MRRNLLCFCVWALSLIVGAKSVAGDLLRDLDESLYLESDDGFYRADLSGSLALDLYYIDQQPPGLIFPNDTFFFSPRLTLALDTYAGDTFYGFAKLAADRGFDPGSKRNGNIRADEYLLRYMPLGNSALNIQIGKFATAFGNYVARHEQWMNPFINAPLVYENVNTINDHKAPGAVDGFLGLRNKADNKQKWVPVIWGPSYAHGASVFGQLEKSDYAIEIKNASLSSRPYAWELGRQNFSHPTVTGRIGYRPNAAWKVGASASHGAFYVPKASTPAGTSPGDFDQTTIGSDVQFAWRHWQVWAEAIASRFELPIADVETIAYYFEAKYKFSSRWYGAARWNQQFYDDLRNSAGKSLSWDRDVWRAEMAVGYKWNARSLVKLQYGYTQQAGEQEQGEQFVAAQLVFRF